MSINEISPELISAQLNRIFQSAAFAHSSTLTRFLQFIVNESIEGNGMALKEYTIAVKVLSKRPDFNPQLDPIVRIHAGRLRRALHDYYQNAGIADEVMISVPKGSYIPVITLKAESNQNERIESLSKIEFSRKRISVAVLPFNNISADLSTVVFADGLGDHLSTELTRYSELAVISYYSCRNIINQTTDTKEAGLLLDAEYVLTGSVQMDNKNIRIRAQLILAKTREQIWANSYDRKSTSANLFQIQDEIVWQVVSQTAGHYGAISRNISKNYTHQEVSDIGVYNAIFWYYNFVNDISADMFFKAEAAMQRAVETDAGYALAWAVLGEIFIGGHFMGYRSRLCSNQLEMAVQYGKTAIKLDPLCQHGYQTIALANIFLNQKKESLRTIEEWLKINPGEAGIKGAMGFILICCGDYEKGFRLMDESVQLNPYYQWWFNAGFAFYYLHKLEYENAIYWAEKINIVGVAWETIIKITAYKGLNNLTLAQKCSQYLLHTFPYLNANEILDQYLNAFLLEKGLVATIKQALLELGVSVNE